MKHLPRIILLISLFSMCALPALAQNRTRTVSTSIITPGPTFIPAGSRVYVDEIEGYEGFENYLVAAFQKKKVQLIIVVDRTQADFMITGYSESQKAGWAKIIFGSGRPEEEASIQVVNLKTGVVAYAVASYKTDAYNGKKSTAEHLAKNLRQKMERDLKRLNNP